MEPTMMVSTSPARQTKKDSSTDGQATPTAFFTISLVGGISPISMPLQIFWALTNCI